MLAGIKQRHMRLIIDLVANHTSDEHKWFVESRSSKDNPYRDFYFWRPGKTGSDGKLEPPNNYRSVFSGSAWEFDPKTNEYYLHCKTDLNWDNPSSTGSFLHHALWLDKGADGFRMDVIPSSPARHARPHPEQPNELPLPQALIATSTSSR
jgi:oligo-1,6-glucosidase